MPVDDPTIISDLVRVTDAYFKVYAKATYFRDRIKVFKPNIPYNKLLPGLEPSERVKRGPRNTEKMSPEDIERSIRRSKKRVREYSEYNKFEILATFTFKTDRQNIPGCMAKMNTWLKNQQKRTGEFDYLVVAEFHKDGKSIHFHALIRGYKGKLIDATHPRTGKPLKKHGRQVYNFASYRHGFSEARLIEDTPESHAKVGNYVGKYITKDMTPALFGKHRYWRSSGVKPPETEDNPSWLEDAETLIGTPCEYGVMYELPLSARAQGA
jgi:hypothetical protein